MKTFISTNTKIGPLLAHLAALLTLLSSPGALAEHSLAAQDPDIERMNNAKAWIENFEEDDSFRSCYGYYCAYVYAARFTIHGPLVRSISKCESPHSKLKMGYFGKTHLDETDVKILEHNGWLLVVIHRSNLPETLVGSCVWLLSGTGEVLGEAILK